MSVRGRQCARASAAHDRPHGRREHRLDMEEVPLFRDDLEERSEELMTGTRRRAMASRSRYGDGQAEAADQVLGLLAVGDDAVLKSSTRARVAGDESGDGRHARLMALLASPACHSTAHRPRCDISTAAPRAKRRRKTPNALTIAPAEGCGGHHRCFGTSPVGRCSTWNNI